MYPPFIALTLTPLLAAGLGLASLTLIQSCLGALGVYYFVFAAARLAFQDRLSERTARGLACAALAGLFLPVSPLKFHLVHLCNDSWVALLLIWVGVVWLRLLCHLPQLTPAQVRWRVGAALALESAALLSRHNAVVMLPAFCLLTWLALRPQGLKTAGGFVLLLLLVLPCANVLFYRVARVRKDHPEDPVMALDLVGLCVEDEALRAMFPYTSSQLVEGRYRGEYLHGNVMPMSPWVPAPIVKEPQRFFLGAHEQVAREWRRALTACPHRLALLKLKAFACYLLNLTPIWFSDVIVDNDLGLRQNRRCERARLFLREIHWRAYDDPVLRWVLARHLPWLAINTLLVLALWGAFRLTRDRRLAILAALLLAPWLYYLSHLLAVAEYSYRYMFPATLFVQLFSVTLAAGLLMVRVKQAARMFHAVGNNVGGHGAPP